jgi:hypothetical protein
MEIVPIPPKTLILIAKLCLRCDREWFSRIEHPLNCPRCNSPYWDRPRIVRPPKQIKRDYVAELQGVEIGQTVSVPLADNRAPYIIAQYTGWFAAGVNQRTADGKVWTKSVDGAVVVFARLA